MVQVKDIREYNGIKYFSVVLDWTEIKDCKVIHGQKGDFVSGPAKKIQKDGKEEWLNLVWFSKEHQEEILKLVAGAKPAEKPAAKPAQQVDDSQIPF